MKDRNETQIRRIGIEDLQERKDEVVFIDARSATALSRTPQQGLEILIFPQKKSRRAQAAEVYPLRGELKKWISAGLSG